MTRDRGAPRGAASARRRSARERRRALGHGPAELAHHFTAAAPFGGAARGVEYNVRPPVRRSPRWPSTRPPTGWASHSNSGFATPPSGRGCARARDGASCAGRAVEALAAVGGGTIAEGLAMRVARAGGDRTTRTRWRRSTPTRLRWTLDRAAAALNERPRNFVRCSGTLAGRPDPRRRHGRRGTRAPCRCPGRSTIGRTRDRADQQLWPRRAPAASSFSTGRR